MKWLLELSPSEFILKIRRRVLPNARHWRKSHYRRCRCCLRRTIILAFSPDEEVQICLHCRANLRYELLAETIREHFPDLSQSTVVEFDPASPLRPILSQAGEYERTFFREGVRSKTQDASGAFCEDMTRLSYPDNSVDLMVSSEVLEHVPDVEKALEETARVLRPGGTHLFTVPFESRTIQRAKLTGGELVHLESPEFHGDPLRPEGILTFWHFGPDMPEFFDRPDLKLSILAGPEGISRRIVWQAKKPHQREMIDNTQQQFVLDYAEPQASP